MSHRCTSSAACPVPPHPDLIAELTKQCQSGQGGAHHELPLSFPTGHVPGLNDATISPPEDFPEGTSSDEMGKGALERAPLRGAIKVAVILVDFSDKPMGVGAQERFKDLFFSTRRIPTGSVTEYYQDVSGGKISIAGEVVGPFRMPRTMKQYANNASGMGSAEPNARTMSQDALVAANSSIDFKSYDNDGNGFVDAFIVVHAGSGAEMDKDKNKIWSMKWTLPSVHTVDGVKVYGFLTVPEDALLGVCAHELGHLVFGWPDLYDIDYLSKGIGDWCLMSGGSWGGSPRGSKPCHPSAYCKSKQQWVVESIDNTNRQITLRDVKTPDDRQVHRLWTNGNAFENEYFLIENRQQTGFDASLPGSGLLIWHIDDSIPNNANESHPKVALEQADGLNQLAISTSGSGDAGDSYPGATNNHSFTSVSKPNSRSYTGQNTNVSVTQISNPGPSMTMRITVKAPTTELKL